MSLPSSSTEPSPGTGTAAGVPAYVAYWSIGDDFSKRLRAVQSEESVITEAASVLKEFLQGKPQLVSRTIRYFSARVERNPLDVCTGLKIFDRAAYRSGGFMTGNVSSDIQFSSFIRSDSCQHVEGHPDPKSIERGQLRAFDLRPFREACRRTIGMDLPNAIEREIRERPDETTILYMVYHRQGTDREDRAGRIDVHGFVLTDRHGRLLRTATKETGRWARTNPDSRTIMEHAIQAFTMATLPDSERPILQIEAGRLALAEDRVLESARHMLSEPPVDWELDAQAFERGRVAYEREAVDGGPPLRIELQMGALLPWQASRGDEQAAPCRSLAQALDAAIERWAPHLRAAQGASAAQAVRQEAPRG